MPSFACKLCGSAAVKPPSALGDSAHVRCFHCDSVVGTWGDIKESANRLIAMERAAGGASRGYPSADPLPRDPYAAAVA
jgi:hypothetical protein